MPRVSRFKAAIGPNLTTNYMLGGTQVDAVYLGTQRVWSRNPYPDGGRGHVWGGELRLTYPIVGMASGLGVGEGTDIPFTENWFILPSGVGVGEGSDVPSYDRLRFIMETGWGFGVGEGFDFELTNFYLPSGVGIGEGAELIVHILYPSYPMEGGVGIGSGEAITYTVNWLTMEPGVGEGEGSDIDVIMPVSGGFASFRNDLGQGDRTASITVSSDLTLGGGASGSFDNFVDGDTATTSAGSFFTAIGESSKHITFDFGVGVTKWIQRLAWHRPFGDMGDWKLQSSPDGSTWTDASGVVDTVTVSTLPYAIFDSNVSPIFTRYWRLLQTAGTTDDNWNVEATFMILDGAGGDAASAIAPDYSNPHGTGDRRRWIDISSTAVSGGGLLVALLNGNTGDNAYFWNSGQSGREFQFDFHEPVLITEVNWRQSNSATHGTWEWEGWDEDTSSWVTLSTSAFTLGGSSPTQLITAMSTVTDYYRLYRMIQVSGTTSNSPWIREIEFEVGYPANA